MSQAACIVSVRENDTQQISAVSEISESTSDKITESVGGETYDTGAFTCMIPKGSLAYPVKNTEEDPDEDGKYPLDENILGIIKGGQGIYDFVDKPTLYIFKEDVPAEESVKETLMYFDETEIKELDYKANGLECIAYELKSVDFINEGGHELIVHIWVPVSDEACFHLQFLTGMLDSDDNEIESDQTFDIDDPDIQTVLDSLRLN